MRRAFASTATTTLSAALLAACASSGHDVSETPTVLRARAPTQYENTITNYFDLTIAGPQKDRELNIAKPEPGGCPVGGRPSSERGWVVPVLYTIRSGSLNGKDILTITSKQYYFWFRADTIAGVTSRLELCP
jgi:hypothetical protein